MTIKPRLRLIFKGPKGEVWQCWSGNQRTKDMLIGFQDMSPKKAFEGWIRHYKAANPS